MTLFHWTCGENTVVIKRLDDEGNVERERSEREEREANMIFGVFLGIIFTDINVAPRDELYLPRESWFPIPLKCIDIKKQTRTTLDLLEQKLHPRLLDRRRKQDII